MSQVIGFVGAGQMGEPMVFRLLGAGHRVVVYARRPSVRERVRAAGAEVVDSVAEAAAASDVVIACVFSDEQLVEVLGGPGGVLATASKECVVVSHTTGTMSTVRGLAGPYSQGPVLLDGPVSGSAEDIAAGRLTVLLGGPAAAVEVARPVLESYAETIVATGDLGSALAVKLVNNALFAANAQLVASAAEVGRRMGIADDELVRALLACSGRSYAAESVHRTGGLRGFERMAAPFLRKDVAACLAATADSGFELGQLAAVIHDGPLELG
ncbi:NAD(P)-dependent oxidoreductase [Nocardia sp. BMG51109]|uniref:NAD(P)-dependent oxidoreductase n=1 Tax=Nocardia sp. BMG51109 TaxID=1056816 RepID=UPI00046678DD|nr:NAD(P)-dependent oxidoreductase [Nocardia sp. BMG51109]